MTVAELGRRMTGSELVEWQARIELEHWRAEQERKKKS